MLVRIKGVIEEVIVQDGMKKDGSGPWQKKSYMIRDSFYRKEEFNKPLRVDEFGKMDKDKMEPEFIYKSYHTKGDEVDIACFAETNEYGFTNVTYLKEYEDIEQKPAQGNVVKPDAHPGWVADVVGSVEPVQETAQGSSQTNLPF